MIFTSEEEAERKDSIPLLSTSIKMDISARFFRETQRPDVHPPGCTSCLISYFSIQLVNSEWSMVKDTIRLRRYKLLKSELTSGIRSYMPLYDLYGFKKLSFGQLSALGFKLYKSFANKSWCGQQLTYMTPVTLHHNYPPASYV